jgi:hypothetical protein
MSGHSPLFSIYDSDRMRVRGISSILPRHVFMGACLTRRGKIPQASKEK